MPFICHQISWNFDPSPLQFSNISTTSLNWHTKAKVASPSCSFFYYIRDHPFITLAKRWVCGIATGSTIRNWHKVKTWLDHMFWQIYQKLMLSGFLSSGNLCLINHLKLFWPHAASTASNRKGANFQHEFSWFCQKFFFQNIKIKLY